jgi:hypothetical protein
MEGFTLTHDACNRPATLTYYTTTDYHWNGEAEIPYDIHNLTLECTHCNVRVEPEPTKDDPW